MCVCVCVGRRVPAKREVFVVHDCYTIHNTHISAMDEHRRPDLWFWHCSEEKSNAVRQL